MLTEEKYAPDAIPSSIATKLYIYYCIGGGSAGKIEVRSYEYDSDPDQVLLCGLDATLEIPFIDINGLKSKALESLNAYENKTLAEHHKKMQQINERRQQLLALTYQPAESEVA